MRFLLIRNSPAESPGLVGELLRGRGIECKDVLASAFTGPSSHEHFEGLAVFGSPESCVQLAEDSPFAIVRDLISTFVTSNRPVLGVCFGGQLLAQALGAKVRRSPRPGIGCSKLDLTPEGKSSPYFADFPSPFLAAQWHSDTFDLPKRATLLATNEACPHQAFSHRNCLAVQFHPELTLDRAREWVEEYAGELAQYGKAPEQVREELVSSHEERARLCERLVDNFLRTTQLG